jgi:hypothetical protein
MSHPVPFQLQTFTDSLEDNRGKNCTCVAASLVVGDLI